MGWWYDGDDDDDDDDDDVDDDGDGEDVDYLPNFIKKSDEDFPPVSCTKRQVKSTINLFSRVHVTL